MRKYKYSKIIQIIVDWWARALLIPKYDNGLGNDPMALLARAISPKVTSQQVKLFKSELGRYLKINFTTQREFCLGVDYEPDLILTKILFKSGIKSSILVLPWKTHMWVCKNEVRVRSGYCAPIDILCSVNR